MPPITMIIVAVLLNAAALWVHVVLPRFVRGTSLPARVLLVGTGTACAVVGAVIDDAGPGSAAITAAIGFGVVHVPAAFILAFKWLRRRGRASDS